MATSTAVQAPERQTAAAAVGGARLAVMAAVGAMLVFVAWYAAARLGHAMVFGTDRISPAWPPNAVLLTALLLTSPRAWPAYLFGALAASVAVDVPYGRPGWVPRVVALTGMAECVVAAVAIRSFLGRSPRLDHLRDVVLSLVAGAGLAPLAAVSAGAAVVVMVAAPTPGFLEVWGVWLLGDVLTHATFTALLLAWLTRAPTPARASTAPRRLEGGALAVGIVLVSLFVLHGPDAAPVRFPGVLSMPLPLLLWAAVRFGARGATSAVAVVTVAAILGAGQGRGPFGALPPLEAVLHLQLFLLLIAVPILLLSVLLSERRQAEAALREREARLAPTEAALRNLTGRLLRLQDEERRRIARELHDGAGQNLVALSMNLARLARLVRPDDRTGGIVADSLELVEQSVQEMRTLSYVLHPPTLDGVGLTSAIRWYVEGFAKRSGIEVRLELPPDTERLPHEVESALFRVIQESLINVHRHSGSGTAGIRLRRDRGVVRLDVTDEGAGLAHRFREPGDGQGSFGGGIPGMRERLRQLGGRLEIRSDMRGTTVTAVTPLLGESDAANPAR